MRLHLFTVVLLSALACFAACGGGDDDSADGDSGGPTATDAPTATETSDGNGDDGGGGDDDGGESGFSEEFGVDQLGNGGTGTIVLGDETLEYDVIVCGEEEDGVYVMSGRGLDAAGEPFVAQVGVEFGLDASAEISRGASSIDDEGDPHWVAAAPETYNFGSGGRLILTFDSTFTDALGTAVDGSVDVNCGP